MDEPVNCRSAGIIENIERQARHQPRLQQDPLDPLRLLVEHLPRGCRTHAPVDQAGVRRWVLHVPPPHSPQMRVGTWPDTPPATPSPVRQVVPAPGTLASSPVRDLVPVVAGVGEHTVGELVLVCHVVVVSHGNFVARHLASKSSARLDDEGVGAQVVRLERERGLETSVPLVERLPRRAVDEVQADLGETGLSGPRHNLWEAVRVMGAVEHLKHCRHC